MSDHDDRRDTTPPPPPPAAPEPRPRAEAARTDAGREPDAGREQDPEARQWAMIAHLSSLVGLLGNGIGFLLGPLVVWAIKKDRHPFVDEQGKEAINFQLSLLIVGVAAFALIFTIVGILVAIPVLIVLAILAVVMPIVAAIRANEGEHYRYPMSWRLIE